MDSLIELGQLVRDGETDWKQYGEVKATYWEGLVLFNYTAKAQYEGTWNWFEQNARGLILDTVTGEIVARPFIKFWNWFEGGRKGSGYLAEVTEKLDGSMGIGFKYHGEWRVATRGSFTGEQAIKGTEMLRGHDMSAWPEEYTPMWEIIYPGNRIVVDYGDREELVLNAGRHKERGDELWHFLTERSDTLPLSVLGQICGFDVPLTYAVNNVGQLLEMSNELSADQEGWVLRMENGQRFKIKGDRYLELHRLIYQASFRHVLRAVESGTYDSWIDGAPDEFLGQIREWRDEIEDRVRIIKKGVEANFAQSPGGSRKEFALWVRENCPELSAYMFARLDEKDYVPMIYREMGKEKRCDQAELQSVVGL